METSNFEINFSKANQNQEFELLSNYINRRTKIKIKHNKCGFIFTRRPDLVIKNNQIYCPYCNHSLFFSDQSEFKLAVQLRDNEYEVVGEYISCDIPVLFKHKTCGNEFLLKPRYFFNDNVRCKKCSGIKVRNLFNKTIDEYSKEVEDFTNGEFSVISDKYINNTTLMSYIHNNCGTIFQRTPTNFKQNPTCPCQNTKSKGEIIIRDFLIENNIDFKQQYTFPDLRDQRVLKFDFFANGILIEYDGIQHFENCSFGAGTMKARYQFELQKRHDEMKNEYCKTHNLKLVRFDYKNQKNIKTELKKLFLTS